MPMPCCMGNETTNGRQGEVFAMAEVVWRDAGRHACMMTKTGGTSSSRRAEPSGTSVISLLSGCDVAHAPFSGALLTSDVLLRRLLLQGVAGD